MGLYIYKERRNVLRFLLSYVACSQIWLNLPMDHCHFGYNTKLTPHPKEKNTGLHLCFVDWFEIALPGLFLGLFLRKMSLVYKLHMCIAPTCVRIKTHNNVKKCHSTFVRNISNSSQLNLTNLNPSNHCYKCAAGGGRQQEEEEEEQQEGVKILVEMTSDFL